MITQLKAELKKMLTVRLTYVSALFALAVILFITFYVQGYKGDPNFYGQNSLADAAIIPMAIASQIGAIVVALFMIHEYRYNTITYTLTIANNRLKVLLAKIIISVAYLILFAVVAGLVGIAGFKAGLAMQGAELVPQTFDAFSIFWRGAFYAVGYGLLTLLVATLVRNIAVALGVLFVVPSLEPLLGLWLKDNAKYLPFNALGQVVGFNDPAATAASGSLTPVQAASVFGFYLVIGWIITAVLFARRDAN